MKKPYDYREDPERALASGDYSIAFAGKNFKHLRAIFAGECTDYAYHGLGYGNPLVHMFEGLMAARESNFGRGFDGFATASGMSAIDILTRFLCLSDSGQNEVIVSSKIYGGAYDWFLTLAPRMGIVVHFVKNPEDISEWEQHLNNKTAFLFLETPGNPTADVFDISLYADMIKNYPNVDLVVDNTLATYVLQQPLLLGATIVLNSASKGINGHSTGLGGIIVAKEEVITDLRNTWGVGCRSVMDPSGARRMVSGLVSLQGRITSHSENALRIARHLQTLEKVDRIYYPFLDPTEITRKQMKAGGPLLGFTIKGGLTEVERFMNNLSGSGVIAQAPHICHTTTLAIHPASTTHARVPEEIRMHLGLTDTFIRVSPGIEDPKELDSVLNAFDDA